MLVEFDYLEQKIHTNCPQDGDNWYRVSDASVICFDTGKKCELRYCDDDHMVYYYGELYVVVDGPDEVGQEKIMVRIVNLNYYGKCIVDGIFDLYSKEVHTVDIEDLTMAGVKESALAPDD